MDQEKWKVDRLSASERTLLRHNAGKMFGSDLQAVNAFYKAIGSVPQDRVQSEQWFSCLCMECLWSLEKPRKQQSFEECLKKIYWSENSDSLKRRILSAMDIPWTEDGCLARKLDDLVRIIHLRRGLIQPDFSALADDLTEWNSPDRGIQRKWIETIFSVPEGNSNIESEETDYAD